MIQGRGLALTTTNGALLSQQNMSRQQVRGAHGAACAIRFCVPLLVFVGALSLLPDVAAVKKKAKSFGSKRSEWQRKMDQLDKEGKLDDDEPAMQGSASAGTWSGTLLGCLSKFGETPEAAAHHVTGTGVSSSWSSHKSIRCLGSADNNACRCCCDITIDFHSGPKSLCENSGPWPTHHSNSLGLPSTAPLSPNNPSSLRTL